MRSAQSIVDEYVELILQQNRQRREGACIEDRNRLQERIEQLRAESWSRFDAAPLSLVALGLGSM